MVLAKAISDQLYLGKFYALNCGPGCRSVKGLFHSIETGPLGRQLAEFRIDIPGLGSGTFYFTEDQLAKLKPELTK
jgi:hypothetical protein